MLYSCSIKHGNLEQLRLVRKFCQGKEKCRIEVGRQFFGASECPGTDASGMSLWLIYSCHGGFDLSSTHNPRCDQDPGTTATPQPTTIGSTITPPPFTTGGSCKKESSALGKYQWLDVPGCGGRIDINCNGGCVYIYGVADIIHFYSKIFNFLYFQH